MRAILQAELDANLRVAQGTSLTQQANQNLHWGGDFPANFPPRLYGFGFNQGILNQI